MTAALEGGEWSAARPGRTLPPGKTRYPLYKRLDGPQDLSGRAENLVPTGNVFCTTDLKMTVWGVENCCHIKDITSASCIDGKIK